MKVEHGSQDHIRLMDANMEIARLRKVIDISETTCAELLDNDARLRAELADETQLVYKAMEMLKKVKVENERLRAALVAVKTAYDSASWTGAIAMAMPAVRAALADEQIADK